MNVSAAERLFEASLFIYAVALPLSMAGTNLALALLSLSCAWLLLHHRDRLRIPHSVYWIAGFFLWAAVTYWIAVGHLQLSALGSFKKMWNLIPYVLIPAAARWAQARTERAFQTLLAVASLVVILGGIQFWTGAHYFFDGWFGQEALVQNKRFYGFQEHPLHTGALYTLLFLSALSAALFNRTEDAKSRIRSAAFYLACALILGFGAILTGSRSYYIGLVLGLIVLAGMKGWKYLLGATLALGLALFVLFKTDPYIENRIRTMSPQHRMDEAYRQRVFIWKSAWQMLNEHPMVGVGYRRWKEALPEYVARFPDWNLDPAAYSHAHNSPLTVGAETGLIGLGLFLGFWVVLLKEQISLLRSSKEGWTASLLPATLAACVALFAAGVSEHNLMTAVVFHTFFLIAGFSRA